METLGLADLKYLLFDPLRKGLRALPWVQADFHNPQGSS